MTSYESVLAQYEKNKNAASGNASKVSQEDRLKKYFTTILDKGKRSGEKRVRLLPTKNGETPFVEVKFHYIQVDGKWLKLYDPSQENGADGRPKRSPLNEVRDQLLMTGIDTDREIAKSYRACTFYIVKLIDRENEQDGPKFWRFKHNNKSEGNFDKIFPIYKNKGDITDPIKGRDLILSLSLTKSGNGKEYTTINSVIPEDVTPLHADPKVAQEWIDDDLTWSDVYAKRGEDYLDMVAKGETPRWDTNSNGWKSDNTSTGESSVGGNVVVEDPQADEDVDTDLPF